MENKKIKSMDEFEKHVEEYANQVSDEEIRRALEKGIKKNHVISVEQHILQYIVAIVIELILFFFVPHRYYLLVSILLMFLTLIVLKVINTLYFCVQNDKNSCIRRKTRKNQLSINLAILTFTWLLCIILSCFL